MDEHHHRLAQIERKLDWVIYALRGIHSEILKMDADLKAQLDALDVELAAETDAETAIENLVTTLNDQVAQLVAGATNLSEVKAKIADLTSQVKARTAKLVASTVTGTPAAP